MKKCSYCGAEYPDDALVCAQDQTPLGQDAQPMLANPRRGPSIFLYSLPFPAVWIFCSLICVVVPVKGFHLGTVGSVLMYMGIASLIGWLFARSERRDFTATEYRNIILYCIGWALLFESITLCGIVLGPARAPGLSARAICIISIITITFDCLAIWAAFRGFGRRVIRRYLEDRAAAETPTPPNPTPPDAASKPPDTLP
jgi:hypothetical protein